MKLRTILFWTHLTAGLVAGIVILIMSVTGTLLTFQQSVLKMIERSQRFVEVPAGAAQARRRHAARPRPRRPCRTPSRRRVTLDSDPRVTASVALGQRGTVVRQPLHGRRARVGLGARARVLPIGDELAPLPLGRGRASCDRPRDHRRLQCRVSRPRDQRGSICGGRGSGRGGMSPPVTLFRCGPARQGARLQLAQRHRLLVRAGPRRADRERDGHLLHVGEQSRLHADRQPATGRRAGAAVVRRRCRRAKAADVAAAAAVAVAADRWKRAQRMRRGRQRTRAPDAAPAALATLAVARRARRTAGARPGAR